LRPRCGWRGPASLKLRRHQRHRWRRPGALSWEGHDPHRKPPRRHHHGDEGQFRDGGRPELAGQEEAEARLIEGYLPSELNDAELEALIQSAIAQTGASSPRDMGQVMKAVMTSSGGRADGRRTSARVREALGA